MPDDVVSGREIRLAIFDWENWWVENVTKRGHLLFAEVFSPHTADPLHGRPAVYLDQGHWSTVAQALLDPGRILSASKLKAAMRIVELASDDGIVLPLGAANFTETSRLHGDRRYEVGVAMASLAGGWQMRHPLGVRRDEMFHAVADSFGVEAAAPTERSVVTLEPHAFLNDNVDAGALSADDPRLFMLAATSSSVMTELLIDPKPLEDLPPAAWTAANQAQGDLISGSGWPKERKRQMSYAFALADHQNDVLSAMQRLGLDPRRMSELSGADVVGLFRRGRMIDLYTRVAAMRHVDQMHKWRTNDLVDMMFLSCAAAYAGYVAAEKVTGTHLAQAQRGRGDAVNVFTSLEMLVEALDRDGVQTAKERRA